MSASTDAAAEPPKSWRAELRRAVRHALGAVPWVWRTHRGAAAGLFGITLVLGLLPAAQAWVGKLIVDGVVAAAGAASGQAAPASGFDWPHFRAALGPVWGYLALEFALLMASALCVQARETLHFVLDQNLRHDLNQLLMRKALQLDLSFFDDTEFYNLLQKAGRQSDWRMMAVVQAGFTALQTLISLGSLLFLLVTFSPWIALLIFAAVGPSLWLQARLSQQRFAMENARASDQRRLTYYELALTDAEQAKEVRLFHLGPEFLRRYSEIFRRIFRQDLAFARRRVATSLGLSLLSSGAYYVAYAWIVFRTVQRALTLGDLTMYLAIVRQCQGLFESLFGSIGSLYEHALFLGHLHDFLALEPKVKPAADPVPAPRPFVRGIEFHDVTFQYARNSTPSLRGISVHIQPGEKIAVVGANGAGKTTFIKLLTRLYDPTAGRITIDGIDLREMDLASLHQRFGVIFQDFVQFEATLRENIALGQVEAAQDEARLREAARKGGADTVAAVLPRGYDTPLGSWFEDSRQLSGGQWQKVATSRAFMRDAEVLVLDEPTSALDAAREYEIFQQFRELTKGKTTILISHRFSTVRMADRILVFDAGALVESGSHAELMALDGLYAKLFRMQAVGYQAEEGKSADSGDGTQFRGRGR
ncbi:MAG: ABC transporter ATP-binding protein [Verrucomicrobia bacterium]|nr:ABC transporter ATP-binding protein [Verrucomicrobiota bacterium]